MPYVRRSSRHMSEEKKAFMFGGFLLTVFLISVITAMNASPRIVLGTELNTNGYVEYLCLGRDCEKIH
ncbi:MAG: hypothetical protein AAF988_04415 [Pseudomonadota bacterium]